MLVGCASAGTDPGVASDASVQIDGNQIMIDAPVQMPMIDAPPPGPMMVTLSQTTSPTIKIPNTIRCGSTAGTAANNYYRVFDLPTLGINAPFTVTQVSFLVQRCDRFAGTSCAVAVRVGTYNGTPGATLQSANMTQLASNPTVNVTETAGSTVNAAITATVPAGNKLYVEVAVPDGEDTFDFFMGGNDGGETGFGYISSATCGINEPTNISGAFPPDITAGARNLLITVTGTY